MPAHPAERRKKTPPQLPVGMTFDELRFADPEIYPPSMVMIGWQVLLGHDIGGNEAKVSYSLLRSVPKTLDLDKLRRQIGMTDDEGHVLPGYYMDTTPNPDAIRSLARQIGIEDLTDREGHSILTSGATDDENYLMFNFTGFPTAKTMSVLTALGEQFLTPEQITERERIDSGEITIIFDKSEEDIVTPRSGRVSALVNSFANVTAESHAKKIAEAQQFAEKTKTEGTQTVYEALDAKGVGEGIKYSAEAAGASLFGLGGIYTFLSSFENGDIGKALIALGSIAVGVGLARLSIRTKDNFEAIEEVIYENFQTP
ncbi:MAG: hypothetical protein AAB532_03795 [Patescibacteria group bacterium]